ncbi:tripartite tricarboxylate transporter substrate binding protein [Rhodoplanes sp. TEM]|uniref:Tripartite tricarboxylate transporter substrate binding protein n=1 Tax=Rhodoplanes tepidamans TaxID=200616 RepID=A0ABT5JIQ0_RHOTP|nr:MULTISPECIES: tripartite tricarboxylate transporter substrate binding protein [Rhodoplanes]MDC7788900.1 tripartite tricarboxylate transporter substrate binding protein [Rhodoplanes tepidamans]MDC7985607.1 tripartite tricarboxylate transporter substrate binding protein [Rhodoplanes sp. TEM]MDQ0358765.1 tripartite-type tricarboxylate transporter receptor subunit TctC [Rhodoplanes tepidamans]
MVTVSRSTLVRGLAGLLAGIAVAAAPAAASAETYPSRIVRMVVGFGPGTSTDIIARLIGNALSAELGQTIVVENRPGSGGSIATAAVARSTPDGYTLTMGTVGTHAINAGLFPRLPYDPLKDFVPIALVGYTPTLLVVPKALPVANVAELVAHAKSRSDGVAFASAGTGTSGHLAGEFLKSASGAKMVHVPYKEGGTGLTDLMAGQVQFMFYHPAAVMPHVRSGALKAIAVSSARRSAAAPDVPTMVEQGFPSFDLVAWFVLYAPAGTPEPVLARLRDTTARVLTGAEVSGQLRAQGVEMLPLDAAALDKFCRDEVKKWTDLVVASGARVE